MQVHTCSGKHAWWGSRKQGQFTEGHRPGSSQGKPLRSLVVLAVREEAHPLLGGLGKPVLSLLLAEGGSSSIVNQGMNSERKEKYFSIYLLVVQLVSDLQ
jgi:hypothetical protein